MTIRVRIMNSFLVRLAHNMVTSYMTIRDQGIAYRLIKAKLPMKVLCVFWCEDLFPTVSYAVLVISQKLRH